MKVDKEWSLYFHIMRYKDKDWILARDDIKDRSYSANNFLHSRFMEFRIKRLRISQAW